MNRREFLIDLCAAAAALGIGGMLLDSRKTGKAAHAVKLSPTGEISGKHRYNRKEAEEKFRELEKAGFIPHDALYWEKTPDGKIRCTLCPRFCTLMPYERGFCRARISLENRMGTLVYGRPCSVCIDPIEKKPVFHFLPGSSAFSIATAGCLFACRYCQNWQISQTAPEDIEHYELTPQQVVIEAQRASCESIAYTYTEPTIFYEYMLDTAKLAHAAGIGNVMISCGFINADPLNELLPYLDVIKVDLKGFTERFYKSICGGSLAPVLETIRQAAKSHALLDIVNLVVPTLNDDPKICAQMFKWLLENAGPDISLFLSRFMPTYRMQNLPPTPISTLEKLRELALSTGLHYVYLGNVPGHLGENTFCPNCGKCVIERFGFSVKTTALEGGKCAFCGHVIQGKWK